MNELYLRINRPFEIEIIDEEKELYEGVVMEAHILETFPKALSNLLARIEKPYLIDPITYKFGIQKTMEELIEKRWFFGLTEKFDPYNKIFSRYDILAPDIWNHSLDEYFTKNVIEYQKNRLSELFRRQEIPTLMSFIGEKVPDKDITLKPEYVIPPYFIAENEKWFDFNMRFAKEAIQIEGEESLIIPLVLSRDVLASPKLDNYIRKLLSLNPPRIIVWITALNESQETETCLITFIQMLHILKEKSRGIRIYNAFSGYFSDLLQKIGLLDKVIHGIGIAEFRDPYAETGPPPPRYYMPFLHSFLSPDNAEILRVECPHLFSCNCGVCSRDIPITEMSSKELLRHFIRVKKNELSHKISLLDAISSLEEKIEILKHVSKEKPIIRNILMPNIRMMERWKQVLSYYQEKLY